MAIYIDKKAGRYTLKQLYNNKEMVKLIEENPKCDIAVLSAKDSIFHYPKETAIKCKMAYYKKRWLDYYQLQEKLDEEYGNRPEYFDLQFKEYDKVINKRIEEIGFYEILVLYV